jgi:hypothetical protein
MAIYGTYHCDDCDTTFKGWRETDGPYPDCPKCGGEGGWAAQAPAIGTNKGKAIDMTYKMAEETYGVTDLKDNLRQGDVAAMPPSPIQTAEADAITREMLGASGGTPEVAEHLKSYVQNFFGATQGPHAPQNPDQAAAVNLGAIQSAAPAAAEARAAGVDPVAILHKGRGMGAGIENLTILSKSKGTK